MNLTRLASVTALALAGSLLGAPAAGAAPTTSAVVAASGAQYCQYGAYTKKSRLVSAHQAASVTHLATFTAPPGYSQTTTKEASKRTVLRGSVKLNAQVSATLGNKIISKGEAKLGLALAAAGSHTKVRKITVKDKVTNNSGKNATIVMFRGNKRGYGKWKRSYCSQVSGSVGVVKWQYGRWGSYVSRDDGHVRCGAGTANINAVAKKAYKIGCA